MDRKVPSATSEEIQLYRSTVYSLLRSTADVKIKTLEEVHAGMNSLMHPGARSPSPDISAFIYSVLRLPNCIPDAKLVVLGQNAKTFGQHGYSNIESWQPVSARARRRRCFFDGKDTLACFIASRSDIEDIIPAMTAFQMEWNKLHFLFGRWPKGKELSDLEKGSQTWQNLCDTLNIPSDDMERLQAIWRNQFLPILQLIQQRELSISVRLLDSSYSQYIRATHEWFENIRDTCPTLSDRPVYFVSSNPHGLTNIVTGFALRHEMELVEFIHQSNDYELEAEWDNILSKQTRSSRENFLYYILKKFQSTRAGKTLLNEQEADERAYGITRIFSEHTFDIEAQIFEIRKLNPEVMDTRLLGNDQLSFLAKSDALILNIDYPLGMAAYNVLSTITIHTDVRGVYTMGKSASLNAVRGDVIIPNVIQDEHSHNTYLFENCFSAADVSSYLKFGTVLDNQKAICVLGTFLQNVHLMDIFFSEGFADIEMEAGSVASAIYEATRPKRYPLDEIVNLYNIPLDFGILHYVSDTPISKGKNLGAGTLSYFGMDSTYACSIAILRRIFDMEKKRIG